MCVLLIPIVWSTFQYNFMHYAQFFQELYWVSALSVSLCPTPRYKKILLPSVPTFTNCKNLENTKNFLLCINRDKNSRSQMIYIIAILKNLIESPSSVNLQVPLEKESLIIFQNTYVCVSGGKKCSFFGEFGELCFLETHVLRFALLPYFGRVIDSLSGQTF